MDPDLGVELLTAVPRQPPVPRVAKALDVRQSGPDTLLSRERRRHTVKGLKQDQGVVDVGGCRPRCTIESRQQVMINLNRGDTVICLPPLPAAPVRLLGHREVSERSRGWMYPSLDQRLGRRNGP